MPPQLYEVDLLIPTARFVFSVEDGRTEVLLEHRSPEAFVAYRELRERRPVVGMTTFPNTVLLRGPRTLVVDPGLPLQNEPVVKALAARGLGLGDIDAVVLTHAHPDHAGACAELPLPTIVHGFETRAPYWPLVSTVLESRPLELLEGRSGDLGGGLTWALTPGHCEGHISLNVPTEAGAVVLCGDTIGPGRDAFDAMAPAGPAADQLLASWRAIRAWDPSQIIAGHLPPFSPRPR